MAKRLQLHLLQRSPQGVLVADGVQFHRQDQVRAVGDDHLEERHRGVVEVVEQYEDYPVEPETRSVLGP